MIKRLTQWRPRPGVDREEALAYWRDRHVELVRKVPGLRRYVQNHFVAPEGAEPHWAGLGEVWFDSIEAADAAQATPEWRAVLDDAATFMDFEHVSAAWAEEYILFPEHEP